MKIYNTKVHFKDFNGQIRDEDSLFVLDDSDDISEFVDMQYGTFNGILGYEAQEVKNLKVSKNLIRSHARQYINNN
jgi:hypothetical protein